MPVSDPARPRKTFTILDMEVNMRRNDSRAVALAALSAVALILADPAPVAAQTTSGAGVPSYAKLDSSVIAQFKADPQSLLASYPAGGPALAKMARNLILNDPSLIGLLMNVAKNAASAQVAAIGAGAAQAARILVVVNPEAAAQIQLAVAQSGLAGMVAAFNAASNATATSSTAALGTSGGLPGSQSTSASTSIGAPSSSTSGRSVGATSGSSAFTSSGAGTSGASTPSGGLTSSTIWSTSPSRSSL